MGPTALSGVREHPDGPADHFWSSTGAGRTGISDEALAGAGLEAVSRTLPADLTSVRQARIVVRDTLESWRAAAMYDDVALVATELVSNALRHGLRLDQRAGAAGSDLAERDTVELSLSRDGDHVICAVTDPSQEPPVPRPGDLFAGSGHGLQLVDSLSLCWGWRVHETKAVPAQGRGKSVWAAFPFRMAAAHAVGVA